MYAIPSGPHADGRDVKPHGIRRNRTSSAASVAPARRARSSRDGHRRFFQNPQPSDGPRRPAAAEVLPAASAPALGNRAPAGDDALSLAPSPDTAGRHAAATTAAPLPNRLARSTAHGGGEEKTTARSPSTDRSAARNGLGLAAAAKGKHAGDGPREAVLPKVKSRQRSRLLRSGASLIHFRFVFLPGPLPAVQFNPPPLPSPLLPAPPRRPASRRDPVARGVLRRPRESGSLLSRYQHRSRLLSKKLGQ